jgi:hypothetical protein
MATVVATATILRRVSPAKMVVVARCLRLAVKRAAAIRGPVVRVARRWRPQQAAQSTTSRVQLAAAVARRGAFASTLRQLGSIRLGS